MKRFQGKRFSIEHAIPVLLIMTSNAPDTMYTRLIQNYQQTLSAFVGPTEVQK